MGGRKAVDAFLPGSEASGGRDMPGNRCSAARGPILRVAFLRFCLEREEFQSSTGE